MARTTPSHRRRPPDRGQRDQQQLPRRARNTNSGNPILANDSDADVRVASNTIHQAELTLTFLELPVLRPSQV
jgi:hypothetical protein